MFDGHIGIPPIYNSLKKLRKALLQGKHAAGQGNAMQTSARQNRAKA
jgi:hypothetical protein